MPPDVQEAVNAKVFQINQTDHAQGHILPNVEDGYAWDRSGDALQARNARAELAERGKLGKPQIEFYQAVDICLTAASEFMQRYADLASDLAAVDASAARAQE